MPYFKVSEAVLNQLEVKLDFVIEVYSLRPIGQARRTLTVSAPI